MLFSSIQTTENFKNILTSSKMFSSHESSWWELNRCGWYIQSGTSYYLQSKYKMSKWPNKRFEHNIFHDEQAIYPLETGKTPEIFGEKIDSIWNLNKSEMQGGDMSFLICGPWPGGSVSQPFTQNGWIFAQFWWQNARLPRTSHFESQQKYFLFLL